LVNAVIDESSVKKNALGGCCNRNHCDVVGDCRDDAVLN